jgi:branched-subunit amino acid aminotransferase/4-amino-4-deoxychorismate lyase
VKQEFVIPVKIGIQCLKFFPGFMLEFIPYLIQGGNDNTGVSNTEIAQSPPVHCGLLAGVYRSFLLKQGKVTEEIIHVQDLRRCSKVNLLNLVRGMWEVELEKPSYLLSQ